MTTTTTCGARLLGLAILLSGSAATAQRLAAYDLPGAAFAELQPPTALLPGPVPPLFVYPSVPPLPLGPAVAPLADSTFDDVLGLHWFSNGFVLAAQPTPTFPPLGPVPGPFPIAPPVLAAIGGVAAGIALNPVAGVMWLVGPAGVTIGVAPVPGTPVLVPPFPLPFPAGPIFGLEWDGMTGSLFAVDAGAVTYNYAAPGVPLAPPLASPIPLPLPMGDIAIDKSGQLNPVGLRPLYVSGGPMVVDVRNPLPVPFPSGPIALGLAYLGHPAANPPIGTCPCPTFAPGPTQFTNSVMSAGNLGWALGVGGLPPGQLVIFAFDFVFNPLFPNLNVVGCGLGLVLGSPTLVTAAGFADPAGNAAYAFPLPVPPGFGPIYNQNLTLCPADPRGFVVTPMRSIWASGT